MFRHAPVKIITLSYVKRKILQALKDVHKEFFFLLHADKVFSAESEAMRKVNDEKRQKPMNDAHEYLSSAGWARISHNPESLSAVYTHKKLPGHQLKIEKNDFSITNGPDIVKPKTPLTKIKSFLPPIPVTQNSGSI